MTEAPPPGGPLINSFAAVCLIIASAFFVGGEYAIVAMRKSRLDTLNKKGSKTAKRLIQVSENLGPFIAGTQIGITLVGIAMGAFTEPFVTHLLMQAFTGLDAGIGQFISLFLVLFFLVVVGELVPKYWALQHPERFMLRAYGPLDLFVKFFSPLIWLAQKTSAILLKPFGISITKSSNEAIPKEELLMLIQAGGADGVLEKTHADMVTRALRLDNLAARDIMVHRLDIRWIDVNLSAAEVIERFSKMRHGRVPVCRGDIDDVVGVAYILDVLRAASRPDFSLEKVARPITAIPENLTMERIVETMRDQKSQFLLVLDEYGGTSGLITLEDVVEEVFGELEDTLESERPAIEAFPGGRISARSEIRIDELVRRLELPMDVGDQTETLAQLVVEKLERVPRPGDSVELEWATLRVENMARRRITRVGIQLKTQASDESSVG